jgi:hypothetical protein
MRVPSSPFHLRLIVEVHAERTKRLAPEEPAYGKGRGVNMYGQGGGGQCPGGTGRQDPGAPWRGTTSCTSAGSWN